MQEQKKNIYRPGSYIYIEGDEDVSSVYLVEKGCVNLVWSEGKIKPHKTSAGAGDIFGFISSLGQRPRMESAVADTESTIVEISRDSFLTMLQKNSDIAMKILNSFADELRAYDEMMLISLDNKSDALPSRARLFRLGEYYYNKNQYEFAYYILLKFLQNKPDETLTDRARELITEMEAAGVRSIPEPIKNGIYEDFTDNQIIFCQHEPGKELYIIKSGRVKILKSGSEHDMILSVLNEGDIFGELAIISDKLRNATAVSYGPSTVLPINRDSLFRLLEQSPDILKKIFTSISRRVWFTIIRLESRLYKKPLTRIYSFLENKLLEDKVSLKSEAGHTLNFGINELLEMTDVKQEMMNTSMSTLLKDTNLEFHFGQITIHKSTEVQARARYYRSRDQLSTPDKNGKTR